MDELIQNFKQIALDAVKTTKPCEVVFGTVTNADNLTITIDQKITVSGDFLIVMQQFRGSYFEVGDTVVMLRCSGGQKFLILGRLVMRNDT